MMLTERTLKRMRARYSKITLRSDRAEVPAFSRDSTCMRVGGETTYPLGEGGSFTIMATGMRASSKMLKGPKKTG